MTATAIGTQTYDAPPVTPLPFGLFSAALVIPDTEGRFLMGGQYQPEACGSVYDTEGICGTTDFGTASVAVGTTRNATLTVTGAPMNSDYSIDWGDGTVTASSNPDADTHTYSADGAKVITITDDRSGYHAEIDVTVTNTATSTGTGIVTFQKIDTDGIPIVPFHPFALYHLFRCRAVGGGWTGGEDRARRSLELGEQRGAERVMAQLLARDPDTVDLTPAVGAVSPVDGIALLEGWSAANYGGVPVIHIARSVGSVLSALAVVQRATGGQQRLETRQGALIASGGGYGPGWAPETDPDVALTAPGAGEAWLYVTGQVVVRRAASSTVTRVSQPSLTNEFTALAERPYAVGWECGAAAVRVTTAFEVPV